MNVIEHYDNLIDENNDSFNDPLPLKEYMDKWDGQLFIDSMCLSKEKSVLEVGVGTGRLATKVLPYCGKFVGIDISPKTINRVKSNLSNYENIELICADFMRYNFDEMFDIIYSSLTLMHIEDKQVFISKIASLLKKDGCFCLSIDKNQSEYIDMGKYKLKIYPDSPEKIISCIEGTDLWVEKQFETEFAHIFVCSR